MRRTYASWQAITVALTLWSATAGATPATATPNATDEPSVEFPLRWYSYPEIAQQLSVGERTVQCAPDLQQCVALVHLKPRPWQAAVRLLSEGLEVRLRKVSDAENRWVLERDPQVAARERRWRQRLKAYLVEEAKHTMQLGEETDYLSELYALFSTSECERLLALRARVNEWLEANRAKYADERALVAAAPLGASEVGESVWQKAEKWVQSRQSALQRRLGVLGEDRGLLVKALLLRVIARIDSLQLRRLYRSLSLEQLLELGTLWGRIDRWGRQWSRDNADLYKDSEEHMRAEMRALSLGRSDVSAELWRAIEPHLPFLRDRFLRGSLEASLLAEASGSEVEEKLVLYRLAREQQFFRDDYLRQLVYPLLRRGSVLQTMVEEAFERGISLRAIELPASADNPTLWKWMLSGRFFDPSDYSQNLAREAEARPHEWYLVLGVRWEPDYLTLEVSYAALHANGMWAEGGGFLLYPFSESDWLAKMSSVLGEEANQWLTRWQAETERALQTPLAQQVATIEKPAAESLMQQVALWAQASGTEVIMELLPSRDIRSSDIEEFKRCSLSQLLTAEEIRRKRPLLRLRVEDGVLRVSSYVSFVDRGVDYPAAAVLQLVRGVQRHAPERFPWEPLEQFCRSVSPDQIRWLEIGTEWVQSRRFGYLWGSLIEFYRLYHGVLRGQGRPIVERGGEVRFVQWSPQALQQLQTFLQATISRFDALAVAVFHPGFVSRLLRSGVEVFPAEAVQDVDTEASPDAGAQGQPESVWRLRWTTGRRDYDLNRILGGAVHLGKGRVRLVGVDGR
jgi:hypothetical protein